MPAKIGRFTFFLVPMHIRPLPSALPVVLVLMVLATSMESRAQSAEQWFQRGDSLDAAGNANGAIAA
ncbi:MAG: hypothetical protein ACKOBV_06765 [Candidatus Kapaibacterium sp.]